MNTLVVGNVGYWSEPTLKKAFGDGGIVVAGSDFTLGKESGITCFPVSVSDEKFPDVFKNYTFDRVVFVSDYLTLHGQPTAEMENLRRLLRLCKREQTEQIVFLSSIEVCTDIESGKKIILQSEEDLCDYYVKRHWLPIKIVRVPFLCSMENSNGYFYDLFSRIEADRNIKFYDAPEQKACFIDIGDLSEFLYRLFDSWNEELEVVNLHSYNKHTYGDIGDWIVKKYPDVKVTYEAESPAYSLELGEDTVRQQLGWFAKTDVLDYLDELHENYNRRVHVEIPFWKQVRERILKPGKVILVSELFGGCMLAEWLTRVLMDSSQFSAIDIRLLFIVLMGNVYGMNAGLAAAFLETVAVAYSYAERGMNWQILFYEPSNWIPFILYFTVGAVCGYVKYRNDDLTNFLKKERDLILEKYRFITVLYTEVLENKREYKKQIIGSRDSFGKIFEVVRHLDKVDPQEIFAESIAVMEDVLSNKSIAIYSIRDSRALFGRLEVSSHAMEIKLPKSVRLEQFDAAMEVLDKGEIWINNELLPDYPMYIAGVKDENGIILLIMIYRAKYDQMGIYYANLFRIICGLIQNSFLKAWKYQEAIRDKIYLDDTIITKETYFMEQLQLRHEMAENGISSYALLQIASENRDIREMDALLRKRIRDTDLLGIGSDGNLYLLLAQADKESVGIVRDRLEAIGFTCCEVSQLNEGNRE